MVMGPTRLSHFVASCHVLSALFGSPDTYRLLKLAAPFGATTVAKGYGFIADSNAFTASAHNTAACFDSAGSPPTAASTIACVKAAI
jgi:hypothetical protein